MKQTIKRLSTQFFPHLTSGLLAYKNLILYKESYLHASGWLDSLSSGHPCDKHGPVPWMNYPVIELLRERMDSSHSLFEFGSGYSTLFYSALVRRVTSIEYDREWYERMKRLVRNNCVLRMVDKDLDGDYCRAILSEEIVFDIVVVDGRDRVNCVKKAVNKLSETGVIILDDSDRSRYAEVFPFLASLEFRALRFRGLKPSGRKVHETTVFYRNENCFHI